MINTQHSDNSCARVISLGTTKNVEEDSRMSITLFEEY